MRMHDGAQGPNAYTRAFGPKRGGKVSVPVRQVDAPAVTNTLWSNVRTRTPSHAFVHPHLMDFDVDVDSF